MINTSLLVLLVALATPLLTYLGVVRRLSGKVRTSDAAQLWEESRSIRKDLQERNEYLRGSLDACEERMDKLEETIRELRRCITKLERQVNGRE